MAKILIVLIGNELANGDIADTNAKYLLQKIKGSDLSPTKIITIPDDREIIVSTLREHIGKVDLILTSGGLGPTTDDITTECVALALDLPLIENKDSLNKLIERYTQRGRPVLENSLKQVMFPEGSLVFPNEVGTADSFCAGAKESTYIISLPGVPKEFQFFIDGPVNGWLKVKFNPQILVHYDHYRVFGLSEAHVGNVISGLKLYPEVEALYRPQFPELLLSFRSKDSDLLKAESERCINALGVEYIYARTPESSLPLEVSKLLRKNSITLSVAESCTGGLLSSLITTIPGASDIFLGSVVSYSNDAKVKFLSVPSGMIERMGAVSPEVAEHMARGIRIKTGSSIGVSATGIAGPGAEGTGKPKGLIYLGLSTNDKEHVTKLELPWDREMNQRYACYRLLDMIRREILGLEIDIKNY